MNWEVRTMRSGTSFFNPTLFRKTLGRFWPLWAVYGLIWVYALPVRCLLGKRPPPTCPTISPSWVCSSP